MNATLRRSIASAAAVLAALVSSAALSSCGFNPATNRVYTPGVGVNERSGTVDVLHAAIVSGTDGRGTVIAALVNNDLANDDALVDVSGAGADQGITVQLAGEIPVEADALVQLADEGGVTVTGDQIRPGQFVALTFTFERAESVTFEVPVVVADDEFADVPLPSDASPSPAESPSPSESPTATEAPSPTATESPAE